MIADDDSQLVARCLSGDAGAQRGLVERYQQIVFSLCLRMLGQRQDAEDVSQEVFLRAFRYLKQWESDRPFRPWLLTIAVNRCKVLLVNRSRKSHQTLVMDPSDGRRTPDGDLAEVLNAGLQKLRDEYRTCIVLFHYQELSLTEVSQIVGSPEGTVKVWLHRARKELAEHLKDQGLVPDPNHELHRI